MSLQKNLIWARRMWNTDIKERERSLCRKGGGLWITGGKTLLVRIQKIGSFQVKCNYRHSYLTQSGKLQGRGISWTPQIR